MKRSTKEVLLKSNLSVRDVRTTVGKNLRYLQLESGKDPWITSPDDLRQSLSSQKADAPEDDRWRLRYLAKLLEERGQLYYDCKDTLNHSNLIDSLCIN